MHSTRGPKLPSVYRHAGLPILGIRVSSRQDESLPFSTVCGVAVKCPLEEVLGGAGSRSVAGEWGTWQGAMLEATSALVGGNQTRGHHDHPCMSVWANTVVAGIGWLILCGGSLHLCRFYVDFM